MGGKYEGQADGGTRRYSDSIRVFKIHLFSVEQAEKARQRYLLVLEAF
jgi:hypothetical protein